MFTTNAPITFVIVNNDKNFISIGLNEDTNTKTRETSENKNNKKSVFERLNFNVRKQRILITGINIILLFVINKHVTNIIILKSKGDSILKGLFNLRIKNTKTINNSQSG
jgi:hypothetical protein